LLAPGHELRKRLADAGIERRLGICLQRLLPDPGGAFGGLCRPPSNAIILRLRNKRAVEGGLVGGDGALGSEKMPPDDGFDFSIASVSASMLARNFDMVWTISTSSTGS
jgi:hypothetical protein